MIKCIPLRYQESENWAICEVQVTSYMLRPR